MLLIERVVDCDALRARNDRLFPAPNGNIIIAPLLKLYYSKVIIKKDRLKIAVQFF